MSRAEKKPSRYHGHEAHCCRCRERCEELEAAIRTAGIVGRIVGAETALGALMDEETDVNVQKWLGRLRAMLPDGHPEKMAGAGSALSPKVGR